MKKIVLGISFLILSCLYGESQTLIPPLPECGALATNLRNDDYIDNTLVDSPTCTNAFSACGTGDYCALAQSGVRLSTTQTGMDGGVAYIENPLTVNPLKGQIAFCGNFVNGNYNVGIKLKSLISNPLLFMKVDSLPFYALDGRFAMKPDTSGNWVYQRWSPYDSYTNFKAGQIGTLDKQLALNGQQCIWVVPIGVRIGKIVLMDSPADDPSMIEEGGGTSADIDILELGNATAPTIGTDCNDSAWSGGVDIPLTGGSDTGWNNANASVTVLWADNKAACSGSGDCLFVRIKQEDRENIDTSTGNDNTVLSQDGGELIISKGIDTTKSTNTIKSIFTTGGHYRAQIYPNNTATTDNTYVEAIGVSNIAGGKCTTMGKCIEARIKLPSIAAGDLGILNARANDKDSEGFFRKIHKGAVTDIDNLSAGSIIKFSSSTILAPPGDTTPPTISNCSVSPSQTGAVITCDLSEPADGWAIYGTTSGSLTDTTSEYSSFNIGGQEKVQITFPNTLTPGTTYFYKVRARDKSANQNVAETVEDSLTTQAAQELWIKATGGNDANDCSTKANACATWNRVKQLAAPGKTIIMATDTGNYTSANGKLIKIDCSATGGWANGTSTNHIKLKMETERGALIISDGTQAPVSFKSCSWWDVEGLRAQNADNPNSSNANGNVFDLTGVSDFTLKRVLAAYPNRYWNSHGISIGGKSNPSTRVLVEEAEVYYFHRNGISVHYSSYVTVRRSYVNSRLYKDLTNCTCCDCVTTISSRGDQGIALYNSSNSTVENSISENNNYVGSYGNFNKMLGNIALFNVHGFVPAHDGAVASITCQDNTYENNVAFKNTTHGFLAKSAERLELIRNSSIANGSRGFMLDNSNSAPQKGTWTVNPSATVRLDLSLYNTADGFDVANTDQWADPKIFDNLNAFENTPNYSADLFPGVDRTTDNPQMFDSGTQQGCVVYVPPSSPIFSSGKGANIIYRYVDGVLTSTKLWNQTTGQFPCGATVNDPTNGLVTNDPDGGTKATTACINVHKRLNVGVNGCPIP